MSRLDELIQRHCHDGVEHFLLGDLEDAGRIKLGRGNVISKADMQSCPGDYPVYSSAATNNGMIGKYGKYMFSDERISWSIDGGGMFFYRNDEHYSITNVGGWLKVLDSNISTRYLYHALLSEWSKKKYDYVHKAHPSVIRVEYTIPVPPLPVQEEIVRILDTFTELEAELAQELAHRKLQYTFYRDQLLNFEKEVSAVKTIEELCFVYTGGEAPIDCVDTPDDEHPYAVYGNGKDVYGYSGKYKIDRPAVTISSIGANTGAVYYRDALFTPIVRLKVVVPKGNNLLDRYLYHALSATKIKSKNGGIPNMNADEIKKLQIPVPSLDVQERLVEVLDNFDTICSSLSIGLPAEIAARESQYNYYRDVLLNYAATGKLNASAQSVEREREREREMSSR